MTRFLSADPAQTFIREQKASMPERRTEFSKCHPLASLLKDVDASIAKLEPLDIRTVRQALSARNERFRQEVEKFEDRFPRLQNPRRGRYHFGIKECVDSRPLTLTLYEYFERPFIHERTAGVIIRGAHVFAVLDPVIGVGFIVGHLNCGGEGVAHAYHCDHFENGLTADVLKIAEAVHPTVARLSDPVSRTKWNVRMQCMAATAELESEGVRNSVQPMMVNWTTWPSVEAEWLNVQMQAPEMAMIIGNNATLLWSMAREVGRTPATQYSHTMAFYDPYRLGRFNDPRIIFDALPNEMFCVTENLKMLKGLIPSDTHALSGSAVASLRYAGFLGGGHVCGVGKKDGNRHILIIDPDPRTLEAARKFLLGIDDVRELTNNGETITLARYNLKTRGVSFLENSEG